MGGVYGTTSSTDQDGKGMYDEPAFKKAIV